LKARIAELEAALGQRQEANASKPPKFFGNDSLGQQEKQRSGRRKKKSPGRRPNSEKLPHVQRTQNVYPDGVPLERCRFRRDRFVWRLELSASQADLLLNHLAKLWKAEFDALVEMMALATVVYMDETGWKVSAKRCYAWVFTSLLHTVLLFGRKRDASVLEEILPREEFQGIGVTRRLCGVSPPVLKGTEVLSLICCVRRFS